MDAAHQEAVARAKAIAARLAGMPAAVDLGSGSVGGNGGIVGLPQAPSNGGVTGTTVAGSAVGNDVNAQAMAALEAAFGIGGGAAKTAALAASVPTTLVSPKAGSLIDSFPCYSNSFSKFQ